MADNSLKDLPDSLKKDPYFLYALSDVRLRMRWEAKRDMFSTAIGAIDKTAEEIKEGK